jgi:hypothetical protein
MILTNLFTRTNKLYTKTLTTESQVIDYVKDNLLKSLRIDGVNFDRELNFRYICSAVFEQAEHPLSESLDPQLKNSDAFLKKFNDLDQFKDMDIDIGSKVAILNLILTRFSCELFGFTTPKTITNIHRDPDDDSIRQFEFNNNPEDVWPRHDISTFNGETIDHSAFFPSKSAANQAVTMLYTAKPTGLKVTNRINKSTDLAEGAIDELERRRIEDLEAKMDDLAHRAREATDPKHIAALRHDFARAKAERDSYHYVKEAGSPAQQAAIAIAMKRAHKKPKNVDESTKPDWMALGEELSVAEKISIFESYYANGIMLESDDHAIEYFNGLARLSAEPVQDKKYIITPLMLIQNRIVALNSDLLVLTFIKQDRDHFYFARDDGSITKFPEEHRGSQGISRTFLFDNDSAYNQFRSEILLKFNTNLPELDQDIAEGWQDFNKVEPYAVCLAGKPVKKFDYYEEARRFHDNWKQKLYREGNMAKAEKITLMPLGLDEGDQIRLGAVQPGTSGYDAWRKSTHKTIKPGQKIATPDTDKQVQAGADKQHLLPRVVPESLRDPWKEKHFGPTEVVQKVFKVKADNGKSYNIKAATEQQAKETLQKHAPDTNILSIKFVSNVMDEGAKVDRMQKYIASTEKKLGHSNKDAEAIAWATLNKRGYLDNANKKKHTESINFMEWTVAQGNRFPNFIANPAVYAAAKAAFLAEGMSNALSNITRRMAQPSKPTRAIKNRENKKDTIKRTHFAEDDSEEDTVLKGYEQIDMKDKDGKKIPNCVSTKSQLNDKEDTVLEGYDCSITSLYSKHNAEVRLALASNHRLYEKIDSGPVHNNVDETAAQQQSLDKNKTGSDLKPGEFYIWEVYFDDGTKKRIKVTKDNFDPKAYYAKKNQVVINVKYDWISHNG